MHPTTFGSFLHRMRPPVVYFVGSGGKTSIILRLVREFQEMRGRDRFHPVVTTTTKMEAWEVPSDLVRVRWDEDAAGRVNDIIARGEVPFIYSGEGEDGRLRGIPTDAVALLASELRIVLVEADGARGMPLKRLRAHEPAIPHHPASLGCLVVGLDALGKSGSEACFNWEGAVGEGICESDALLDPLVMRQVLYRSRGYLDALSGSQDAVLIVNKADSPGALDDAEALARALFHPQLRALFVSTTINDEGKWIQVTNASDRVFGVILAAGEAKRFRRLKQLEPLDGATLLGRAVDSALACAELERVILVLGHEHEAVRASIGNAAASPRLDIVVNPDYMKGLSTSLRAGLTAARSGGCDAVAFLLGDMPLVDPALLSRVIGAYRASCCRAAFVRFERRMGHPVIFRKELFDELFRLQGNTGGREVIRSNIEWCRAVDLAPGERKTQIDIDDMKGIEGYRAACREGGGA